MKIPASKLIELSILRLLRILLERAICFLSYLLGLVIGLMMRHEDAPKWDNPGRTDLQGLDKNQIRPPFR